MIDYLIYLFMRYTPIAVSAVSAAYLIIVTNGNPNPEEMKSLATDSLVLCTVGWALLFIAHEDIRGILSAVETHLKAINNVLDESNNTKTD